ncbi:MAG TPA: alpha/beta fold hydrolase, partial [Roseiflexaceae bacterium]|nr:alpha/beta fold hydrolase [Roseiflexaceae bacterium]
ATPRPAAPRPPQAPTPSPVAAYAPRFEPAGCPFDTLGERVECGYLVVPESRAKPDGRQVKLAVAIVRSTAARPAPDPVVYLEGGPGGSALYDAAFWFDSPLRKRRDIVLIDQRGTGYSLPSLNCPEIESAEVVSAEDELAAARACSRRLRREGVDLKQYNSAATAADVADLRVALRLEQLNLLGVSYGTRAALTAMRDNPEGIRSVILDSAYPPQVDAYTEEASNAAAAIESLLRGCAEDRACARAYPKLDRTFYRLVERLNRAPAALERTDPDTGEVYEEELYGDDLVDYLVEWLYDTTAIPLLPRAIAETARGEHNTLLYLLDGPPADDPGAGEPAEAGASAEGQPAASGAPAMDTSAADAGDISDSEGAFYSVECREEVIFGDREAAARTLEGYPSAIHEALLAGVDQVLAICEVWGAGRARALEERPVTSAIPTLVLAGEYDPVTPPRWGQAAVAYLSNSFFFEFPGMGHGVFFAGPCPEGIALAFLERPSVAPDAACIEQLGGPVFEVP